MRSKPIGAYRAINRTGFAAFDKGGRTWPIEAAEAESLGCASAPAPAPGPARKPARKPAARRKAPAGGKAKAPARGKAKGKAGGEA